MTGALPGSDNPVQEVVSVRDLVVLYADGTEVAIRGLPMTLAAGERAALLGANGSGKSTLLRAVLGLVRPARGTVRVFGHDPAREFDAIQPRVGGVLQDVEAQLLAPTVREDLAFGLEGRDLRREEIQARVEAVASRFALTPLLDKVPHYLSGGEKRKVALAGALVTEPDLLVLDEPFASLDPESVQELVEMLQAAHAHRPLSVLLTTHEVQELPALVDTIYVLSRDGSLVVRDTPAAVFAMPDVLAACNVAVPPLVRLVGALRRQGIGVADTESRANPDAFPDGSAASDPEALAAALASLFSQAAAVGAQKGSKQS